MKNWLCYFTLHFTLSAKIAVKGKKVWKRISDCIGSFHLEKKKKKQ